MRPSPWPDPVAETVAIRLVDQLQQLRHALLVLHVEGDEAHEVEVFDQLCHRAVELAELARPAAHRLVQPVAEDVEVLDKTSISSVSVAFSKEE